MIGIDPLYDNVVEAINRWKPSAEYTSEPKYRDDLQGYLLKVLNRPDPMSLIKQSAIVRKEAGRGLCDLEVNRRIGIELKRNLKSKEMVDRLTGQINNYEREYSDIIIVLVGNTDTNHFQHLRMDISRRRDRINLMDPKRYAIIKK